MRLVCPKCVAQYEVDDQSIPDTGREVQCANCDHIWFQDSILMHPEREDEPQAEQAGTAEAEDNSIFEDLAGVRDSVFKSARAGGVSETGGEQPVLSDDMEDGDFDDDAPMDPPREIRPVDPEILNVLRTEAAFSSARAKLDAAAALALDQPTTAGDLEPEGLTSFLADHQEKLAAAKDEDERPVEYEAMLPKDDPIPTTLTGEVEDDSTDEDPVAEEDQETDEPDEVEAHADADLPETDTDLDPLAAETEAPGTEIEDSEQTGEPIADEITDDLAEGEDDFDEDTPRRTYRADGAGQDETAEIPDGEAGEEVQIGEDFLAEDPDESEPPVLEEEDQADIDGVDSVSAALGALRPRVRGGSARARTIPGAEAFLAQAPPNTDEPVPEPPQQGEQAENLHKPAQHNDGPSRKELLPDVEELDSTLRGGPARSKEDLAAVGAAQEVKNTGFGSSFIRAFFLVALLMALYVLRPKIIELVPQAAVVLDPYANLVDSVRLMIDGIVSKVLGG